MTPNKRWMVVLAVGVAAVAAGVIVLAAIPGGISSREAVREELIGRWVAKESGSSVELTANGRVELEKFPMSRMHGPTIEVDATGTWSLDAAVPTGFVILFDQPVAGVSATGIEVASCSGHPCLLYGPEDDLVLFFSEERKEKR